MQTYQSYRFGKLREKPTPTQKKHSATQSKNTLISSFKMETWRNGVSIQFFTKNTNLDLYKITCNGGINPVHKKKCKSKSIKKIDGNEGINLVLEKCKSISIQNCWQWRNKVSISKSIQNRWQWRYQVSIYRSI